MKKLVLLIAFSLPSLASAHAVLEQKEVETGSYYKAVLGIGHGCDGATTTKITIELPEGVHRAKPMPKAGWQVETVVESIAIPYTSYGKQVTEDVTKIIWSGGELLDSHFDEFVFKAKIDAQPQTLFFTTKQQCAVGEINWAEIPAKGKTTHDYKYPAPALKVINKTKSGHHH
ncbi:hypothetical protein A9Q78_09360 [Methylophaga sp. 41_12_T18]|nr:hypothetical protein A9Q78_09360 [Methylophaga sp. 41_12_T18]